MVLAAQYGTISDIEILWTLLAVVGATFSAYNYKDAIKDREAVMTQGGNRDLQIIATSSVYLEMMRLLIQSIFVTIGVLAMLVPNTENLLSRPWQEVAINAAITWGLILASGLVMAKSVYSYFIRKQLLD